MLDVAAIKARAALRTTPQHAASPANAANWLTPSAPISQLATLATPSKVTAPANGSVADVPPEFSDTLTRATPVPPAVPSIRIETESTTGREQAAADKARAARVNRTALLNFSIVSAERVADRLAQRDDDGDDRRMCVECSHLGERGRCIAASAGRIWGADRRLEPVQTILQRCEAFGLKKGLT